MADKTFSLSPVQVIAGALATVSAAVVTSFAGAKGTMIGMAMMSVVATSASAVYSGAMKHGVRMLRPPIPPIPPTPPGYTKPRRHQSRARAQWQRRRRYGLLAAMGLTFALALTVVTGIELGAGESIGRLWGNGGDAPSVIGGGDPPPRQPMVPLAPSPTVTTPSTSATPSLPAPTLTEPTPQPSTPTSASGSPEIRHSVASTSSSNSPQNGAQPTQSNAWPTQRTESSTPSSITSSG